MISKELSEDQKGEWALYRLDDNGTTFRMREGLSESFAKAQAKIFQDRGHKQTYWAAIPEPGEPVVRPLAPG